MHILRRMVLCKTDWAYGFDTQKGIENFHNLSDDLLKITIQVHGVVPV